MPSSARVPAVLLALVLGVPSLLGAEDRGVADATAAQGLEAMRASDADPHRGVDAAIAFSQALAIYRRLGDAEACAQMQADIFWCKKRMNLDDLQDYLAHKGGSAASDFATARAVIERQVPVSEAADYLARAQRFQEEHPDDHFEIAIRFSEIIERFPDTDASRTAEPVFAREQSAYLAQVAKERVQEHQELQDAIQNLRSTRFMEPPAVATGTTAVPDAAAQERALAAIHSAYHAQYVHVHRDSQRRTLAHKLYADCDSNRDDAAYYYEMLEESARLSIQAGDWEQLLQSVEKEGQTFAHFDVVAHKKQLLGKVRSEVVPGAILTLLNNPRDRAANTIAGKAFCFSIGRWDLGLPMLADGDDAGLHRAAEMELANPTTAEEFKLLGDSWYELGRHVGSTERNAMWERAHEWYQKALPGLGGINQTQVSRVDTEIQDALPLTGTIDWDNLTERQWHKLRGQEIHVESKVDRSNGLIMLTDEYRVRVVPFPSDRDKMVFQVGNPGPRQPPGVLSGNGQLWIIPTTPRRGSLDQEVLRLKVVEVEDQ